jgi:phage recombination protein Bet
MPQGQPRISLLAKIATRYNVDPKKLMFTLKATAFRQRNNEEITDEQMMALLIVADQYGLNPFTKEIYAYPDKQNGIVPVVGVDGWARIINSHPELDGIEFHYSDEIIAIEEAQPCPVWCEVVFHRKDRAHATTVREYLEECYRPPFTRQDGSRVRGPWQTHTRRFLRHKTLIQGARIAFGFVGIYDDDEAQRIQEHHMGMADVVDAKPARSQASAQLRGETAPAAQTAQEAPEREQADAPAETTAETQNATPEKAPAAPLVESDPGEPTVASFVANLERAPSEDEILAICKDAREIFTTEELKSITHAAGKRSAALKAVGEAGS